MLHRLDDWPFEFEVVSFLLFKSKKKKLYFSNHQLARLVQEIKSGCRQLTIIFHFHEHMCTILIKHINKDPEKKKSKYDVFCMFITFLLSYDIILIWKLFKIYIFFLESNWHQWLTVQMKLDDELLTWLSSLISCLN